MTAATLLALALLAPAAEPPHPAAPWIDRLGSPRYAAREEAVAALVALGDPAIPALVQAANASDDPEIRARAAAVVEAIHRQHLTRPTLLTIDLVQRPLDEAVATLSTQTGLSVSLDPALPAALQQQPITLQILQPIPFWQALDRLATTAHLRPVANPSNAPADHAAILLTAGPTDHSPHTYSGPFRIRLGRSARQNPNNPGRLLEVAGEPGHWLAPAGPLILDHTSNTNDDEDDDPAPNPAAGVFAPAPLPGMVGLIDATPSPRPGSELTALRWPLPPPPKRPATLPDRIAGKVPVLVAIRAPEPTIISLTDATGASFLLGDTLVQIVRSNPAPNNGTLLSMRLRRGTVTPDPFLPTTEPGPASAAARFEVVDAQGQPCQWNAQATGRRRGGDFLNLLLIPSRDGLPPAKLRIHRLIETVTEVPFDFAPETPR